MYYFTYLPITRALGLTLIEMLLSLTISLLIFSVITEIYLNVERKFALQLAFNRVQEEANMTEKILHTHLKLAGYIGCAKLTENFPLRSFKNFSLTPQNKISVSENTISVRHASLEHANLLAENRNKSTLYIDNDMRVSLGNILLISDCASAEIFQVKKVMYSKTFQKIITTKPLLTSYKIPTEISKFEMDTYFIDKTQRQSSKGIPIFALYSKNILHKKIELVEGVLDLKIKRKNKGMFLIFECHATVNSVEIKKVIYQFIGL